VNPVKNLFLFCIWCAPSTPCPNSSLTWPGAALLPSHPIRPRALPAQVFISSCLIYYNDSWTVLLLLVSVSPRAMWPNFQSVSLLPREQKTTFKLHHPVAPQSHCGSIPVAKYIHLFAFPPPLILATSCLSRALLPFRNTISFPLHLTKLHHPSCPHLRSHS
jgi:hypothetical protein